MGQNEIYPSLESNHGTRELQCLNRCTMNALEIWEKNWWGMLLVC
jgi:hypothetical protein